MYKALCLVHMQLVMAQLRVNNECTMRDGWMDDASTQYTFQLGSIIFPYPINYHGGHGGGGHGYLNF
jgi:hypothetical protein